MPDNNPRQAEDRKFFSKSRLRGKLFSGNDEQTPKEPPPAANYTLNDDVVDFLKPSTSRAKSQPPARITPKLDVSAALRWPNAADVRNNSASPGLPPHVSDRKLARRNLNLRVDFARTAPEIIGEGGDEAELPAVAVRRLVKGVQPQYTAAAIPQPSYISERGAYAPGTAQVPGGQAQIQRPIDSAYGGSSGYSHDEQTDDNDDLHPGFLKRAATGYNGVRDGKARPSVDSEDHRESLESERSIRPPFPNIQTSFQGSYQSTADHPRLPEIQSVIEDSPIELRHELKNFLASDPSNPNSLAARVKQKMKADEGRALQEARRNPQLLASEEDAQLPKTSQDIPNPSPRRQATTQASYNTNISQAQPTYPTDASPATSSPSIYSVQSNDLPSASARSVPQIDLEPPPAPPIAGHSHSESTSTITPSTYANTQLQQPVLEAPLPSPHRRPVPRHGSPPRSRSPNRSSRPTPSPSLRLGPSPNPTLTPSPSAGYNPSQNAPSPGYFPQQQPPPSPRMDLNFQVPEQQDDPSSTDSATRSMAHRPSKRDDSTTALNDFSERVIHMRGIFKLTADMERPLNTYSPMQCLRAAIWWFLKGRAGLEILLQNRPRPTEDRQSSRPKEQLSQPHVDLAKTWWLVTEVMDTHPSLAAYQSIPSAQRTASARSANDVAAAEVFDIVELITSHLKVVVSSMSRNQIMPPRNALIQGQDQSIWVKYPNFKSDIVPILSGQSTRSMTASGTVPSQNAALLMPLNDSKTDFSYGKAFVNVSMSTEDAETDRVQFSCVTSIIRSRGDWEPKVIICSQSELVSLTISSDQRFGPSWDQVDWRPRMNTIYVQLPRGFTLTVEFPERDFNLLYNILERSRTVEGSLAPAEDEKFIHEVSLLDSHYIDPTRPQAFPTERIPRCRARVFEKLTKRMGTGGERRFHRGYRLLLITSPRNKHLYSVSQEVSMLAHLHIEFTSDKQTNGAPAVIIRFKTEGKPANMFLVFGDPKERLALYTILNGSTARVGEALETRMALKKFSLELADQDMKFSAPPSNPLEQLQWQDLHVINVDMEGRSPIESTKTVMSESLRVVARNTAGAIVDRMNLGPGKLQFRLSTTDLTSFSLLREPQSDMTLSLDPSRADKRTPEALDLLLESLTTANSIRTFTFESLQDLHSFQTAVTGHAVLFDSIASTLAISRRRMVVPIYKQWSSTNVRIQVVQHNNITQLLAFFANFAHADAMAIRLQAMDVFQKDKPCAVRIVDAKFPLPREGARLVEDKFIALEAGAYPGEHDDIVVGFDAEETREKFLAALPAQTQMKKLVSFKRKI